MLDFAGICVIVCMARLITEKRDTLTRLPFNFIKGYYSFHQARRIYPGAVCGRGMELNDLVSRFVHYQGIALGLGVAEADSVTSPTFVYLRTHQGRMPLYHMDAYRLAGAEQFFALGGWEMLEEDGVSVIEWADHLASALPPDRLDVRLAPTGPSSREISLAGVGKTAARLKGIV